MGPRDFVADLVPDAWEEAHCPPYYVNVQKSNGTQIDFEKYSEPRADSVEALWQTGSVQDPEDWCDGVIYLMR